jgi:hypothetical protein
VCVCSKVDDGDDVSVPESVGELGMVEDLRVGEGRENGEEEPPMRWLSQL